MQLICWYVALHVPVHHTYLFTLIYSTQSQVYSHKSHSLPFCQGSTAQGKIHSITPAHCHACKFIVMSNESSGLPPSFPPFLPPSFHADPPRLSSRSQSPLLSEETCSMNDSGLHCSHISLYLINYALIYQADEQHMLILEAKGQRWVSWRWNDELCFAILGLQRIYSEITFLLQNTKEQCWQMYWPYSDDEWE